VDSNWKGKFQQPESHKGGVVLLLRNKNVQKALAHQADKKINKIKHNKGEQLNVFLHLPRLQVCPRLSAVSYFPALCIKCVFVV